MGSDNIVQRINEELVNHPQIDANNIWINVEEGHVTLAGSVPDPDTIAVAEEAVINLDGVEDVTSIFSIESECPEIHVSDPPPAPKDPKVQLKIQIAEMTSEGGLA
jgi:BON domain